MPAAAAPWLLLAVFSGTLISLQARITGELAAGLGGDGFAAAVISFGSGFVVLTLGLLVLRKPRRGVGLVLADVRARRLRWWQVLGGFGGAAFLLAQGLTVGALGVALFTVAIVAGQVTGGLLFDRMGLGPAGPQRPTRRRVVGAVLVLAAVGLSMADKLGGGFPYLMLLLPLVAGVCVSWQQAVNGHVKNAAGSAYAGTFFNFVAGTGALSVIFLVHAGRGASLPPADRAVRLSRWPGRHLLHHHRGRRGPEARRPAARTVHDHRSVGRVARPRPPAAAR
ncbi:DMT family transporter [Streptomyces sp. NPDC055243]|uniref:DMT family transporter n=1 Tax=Streptomyces sp. NPDC055243 TaxID=3365720 RepID=UPI0037D56536